MNEKRYAIVRVDGKCPDEFEKIDVQFTCRNLSCYAGKECYKNFYGDTKEQLVMKVAQVIKRVTNDGYVIAYKKFGTGYINTVLKNTEVAKEIVEFLGVE